MFQKSIKLDRKIPVHIGIIMDGNGRWAKKRLLPRSAGHAAGSNNFKTIARYCNKIGVKYLTAYAFSTENWKRPQKEIDNIMNILRDYLKDTKSFKDENIALKFIGNISELPRDIIELMKKAEEDSEEATGLVVNLAVNYGGRDEIVTVTKKIANDVLNGNIMVNSIDDKLVDSYMYTSGQPALDFIIRPSGEYRLSNFLIWQAAYAEFWFSDVLWPDFSPKHLEKAIDAFSGRDRRFGGVK